MSVVKCFLLLLALVSLAWADYRVVTVSNLPGGGQSYVMTLIPGTEGPYGGDIQNLAVDVIPFTDHTVRVRVRDANATRWEVPGVIQAGPQSGVNPFYSVNLGHIGGSFQIQITRLSDNSVLFDTTGMGGIIYENQYLSVTTRLPTNPHIYGLGERAAPLRLPLQTTYTIFARDTATPYLDNVYGAHAFYMEMRNGKAHGVYLLNSNAMDVVLNTTSMTYKVIGGILDFFFFIGPTPRDVTLQYINLIGKPEMIPYWGLGWQQCRWGYLTLEETKAVVSSYRANNIPLEVMWNDIDYMDAFKDFTTDPLRFPVSGVRAFIDDLHANHQRYIMIVDPGIKIENGYAPYEDGLKADIYIRNKEGKYLTGLVWPGHTYYPDFTNPATHDYWYKQFLNFHNEVPFDGIWIDMNEVSNFCDGECKTTDEKAIAAAKTDPKSGSFDPDNPPYKPINGNNALDSHTISLSAQQHLGLEYNVHSMYGHYEGMVTRVVADKIFQKRSLIVSRSTFVGSGRHVSHWLGDNHSTWRSFHLSIAGVVTMGMFGIPHVGADICGFAGNTTKELCTRWIQLGAFYPFSRDHNALGMISQEPYAFGPDVAKIAASVIRIKYTLLPYYYTLHFRAHTVGDPVARALFYEFPNDPLTLSNDVQMMIGSHLLITPVLADGARIVHAYLPAGVWYDFYSGSRLVSAGGQSSMVQLDAPIDKINLHVRGGGIIPRQAALNTTEQGRNTPYNLLVARDANGLASGELFIDDGESFLTIVNKQYSHISFAQNGNLLTTTPVAAGFSAIQPLGEVVFYGITVPPKGVTVNGVAYAQSNWSYTKQSHRLTVSKLNLNLLSANTIAWN